MLRPSAAAAHRGSCHLEANFLSHDVCRLLMTISKANVATMGSRRIVVALFLILLVFALEWKGASLSRYYPKGHNNDATAVNVFKAILSNAYPSKGNVSFLLANEDQGISGVSQEANTSNNVDNHQPPATDPKPEAPSVISNQSESIVANQTARSVGVAYNTSTSTFVCENSGVETATP